MPRILVAMPDKCTGCDLCLAACAAAHAHAFDPSRALLGVEHFPLIGRFVPSVCFHCANPDCMAACPEGAISHDESGTVLVRTAKCTGCGACEEACPWGQIRICGDGLALKCDLCGGEPACAAQCHYGALVFAEPDRELRTLRGRQMKDRCANENSTQKRCRLAERLVGLEDKA